MRWLLFLLICSIGVVDLSAQSSKRLKDLEKKRLTLQKEIQESENTLKSTRKDVTGALNNLATLNGQIDARKRYIRIMTDDLESINQEIGDLEKQLGDLEVELGDKKRKYEASVQYLRKNKTIEEKLLFIFSAQDLNQTYRRLRYVNEYATYQRLQGQEILTKQTQVNQKKEELHATRASKERLLREREHEQQKLLTQEKAQRQLASGLQKRQKEIEAELKKKRRQASQLNNQIDKLIAEEIERSRKRAAAEARKRATASTTSTTPKATPMSEFVMSDEDRQLSGSFATNRGKLPIPVTGAYTIVSRYGQNTVDGLRNVKLENKGIDIQTQPGAQARAVFDGEVSAVFQYQGTGMYNILLRHGNYISIYCNLSAASVKKGDKVKTRQSLGTIFSDKQDNNRTVLHFQLRKEKALMNPEPWLRR
ncbi:MAG: peptidoglycan DD-metalloendopeptidase family protein [Bacteroides sp.]|nr:peptidoglycan DD-metalloendopeptidase family protein [Bacteroides sp.]